MNLEHVIVWHQVDTLSTVKRLYGRLTTDLKSSDHYLLLIDNCKSKSFAHSTWSRIRHQYFRWPQATHF